MTLTAEQLVARRSRIGSSDAAAILGMPTFKGKNAFTTWLEKTDLLEPEKNPARWLTLGNRFEPAILDFAEERYGTLERNVVVFDPCGGPIASTLDARVVGNGLPLEAKTTGLEGPIHGNWGDEYTDEVPDGYIVQAHVHLLCTKKEMCPLFALIASRGIIEYRIEPVDALLKTIGDACSDFYERYVAPKKDPRGEWADRLQTVHGLQLLSDPCEPVLEVTRRLRKTPGKSIVAPDSSIFYSWYDEARAERLAMEKVEGSRLAKCLAEAGDAEAVMLADGREFTNMLQSRTDIDRDALRADGLYDKYAKRSEHRVARIKKAK